MVNFIDIEHLQEIGTTVRKGVQPRTQDYVLRDASLDRA